MFFVLTFSLIINFSFLVIIYIQKIILIKQRRNDEHENKRKQHIKLEEKKLKFLSWLI